MRNLLNLLHRPQVVGIQCETSLRVALLVLIEALQEISPHQCRNTLNTPKQVLLAYAQMKSNAKKVVPVCAYHTSRVIPLPHIVIPSSKIMKKEKFLVRDAPLWLKHATH